MNRLALVTGASRGIGAAIAEELAAAGCAVLLNYRSDVERAESVKARIEAAGGSASLLQFDVGDREACAAALRPYLNGETTIDIVVNNAGVARDAPFPKMSEDDWDIVSRTTLGGFFNVTRPLVMPLVLKRWGRIINIASLSALVGNRGQVNYTAAKAGLIGATRSLSRELAKRQITVNAVAPGYIETDMVKDLPAQELARQVPMQRLGQPAEVAKLVRFLASDDAGYITGQVISINGGLA